MLKEGFSEYKLIYNNILKSKVINFNLIEKVGDG